MNPDEEFESDIRETAYAQGRFPSRTYASKSFPLKRTNSADDGTPARFICKVFDPVTESCIEREGEEWLVRETPAGRYQIKLLVAREAGNVKQLWIQRIPQVGSAETAKNLLNLTQPDVNRLLEFLSVLKHVPVEGATSIRVDDSLVEDLFADSNALAKIYHANPARFRQFIEDDATAHDVVALAARREAVSRFKAMLNDNQFFDALIETEGKGSAERVWQRFFESNPWILGVSLSSQLLTSWDNSKLEQIIDGFDITGVGKRTDALMKTTGRVRSMVFLEIKTHRTELLGNEYRSGCWSPSSELIGGLAQIQGTVYRAVSSIGERIASTNDDGSEIPGDFTYLIRPRSLLLVGKLGDLTGATGGDHVDRIRSFELFRRSLNEPEIITFDELFAKANFIVNGLGKSPES